MPVIPPILRRWRSEKTTREHRIRLRIQLSERLYRSSWQPPAVAFALGIALQHLPYPFGNDALRVTAVTATAVIDRLRIVAEADDGPAANRTALHRRHRARSILCARAGSTATR